MTTILITRELAAACPRYADKGQVVDASQVDELISELKKISNDKILIYDLTNNPHEPDGMEVSVQDHINRTGSNPIIGRQKTLGIDFTDLTHLYHSGQAGVVTNCVGDDFSAGEHSWPSSWLCNVAILGRAMGFRSISAVLVNGSRNS